MEIENESEIENDGFEDEEEAFEKEVKKDTSKKKSKSTKSEVVEEKPQEKYVAFYQEPRIGIVNTLTGEIEQEGFENPTTAQSQAKILNMLDKISITSGVQ